MFMKLPVFISESKL